MKKILKTILLIVVISFTKTYSQASQKQINEATDYNNKYINDVTSEKKLFNSSNVYTQNKNKIVFSDYTIDINDNIDDKLITNYNYGNTLYMSFFMKDYIFNYFINEASKQGIMLSKAAIKSIEKRTCTVYLYKDGELIDSAMYERRGSLPAGGISGTFQYKSVVFTNKNEALTGNISYFIRASISEVFSKYKQDCNLKFVIKYKPGEYNKDDAKSKLDNPIAALIKNKTSPKSGKDSDEYKALQNMKYTIEGELNLKANNEAVLIPFLKALKFKYGYRDIEKEGKIVINNLVKDYKKKLQQEGEDTDFNVLYALKFHEFVNYSYIEKVRFKENYVILFIQNNSSKNITYQFFSFNQNCETTTNCENEVEMLAYNYEPTHEYLVQFKHMSKTISNYLIQNGINSLKF